MVLNLSLIIRLFGNLGLKYNQITDMDKFKSIGDDVFISEDSLIKRPHLCQIGSHNAIDNGVTISTELIMGDYIHIAPFVVVIGGEKSKLILEDFSFVASGTKIVCGSEDYTGVGLVGPTIPEEYRVIKHTTVKFEKFAGCGVNCSIMPGVTLAEGSILGANSLLTKDTEPWTIYVGSPARPVKTREKETILNYAKKIKNDKM
jgi:acetyltransferase-like isoleucine patch superfamily enzyme